MVATEFIAGMTSLTHMSVEDFADKFNFVFTVLALLICTAIVTVKQYILNPITCYISTDVGGSNLLNYVENYCWVQGTLPITYEGKTPSSGNEWKSMDEKKILYYQWVPFVLGIQCIFFYVPKLVWQTAYYRRTGIDLESIVMKSANAAAQACPNDRQGIVADIATSIEQLMFQQHRRNNGRYSYERLKFLGKSHSDRDQKGQTCIGRNIVSVYLVVKFLCVINAIGQLLMMQRFLGFRDSASPFGIRVLEDMINGRDWQETQVFPRVGFCFVQMKILGVQSNGITAQCALPVNMLNEKIFVFLWWWILLDLLISLFSLVVWLARQCRRWHEASYIVKYISLSAATLPCNERDPWEFSNKFLCWDGMFLLRMIRINAGDIVASEVVKLLWENYMERRSNDNINSLTNMKLPTGAQLKDETMKSHEPSKETVYPSLESGPFPSESRNAESRIIV